MNNLPRCAARARRAELAAVLAAACGLPIAARAATEDEVRASFERFVQVQNAHDLKALEGLLADSPRFLWITRGNAIWGRDAALKQFGTLYQGTWQLEPEPGGLYVVPLAADVAQLHVPVRFTIGPAGQAPQVTRFLLNQVLVRSEGSWRVMSILPIAAPAN